MYSLLLELEDKCHTISIEIYGQCAACLLYRASRTGVILLGLYVGVFRSKLITVAPQRVYIMFVGQNSIYSMTCFR